VETESPVTPRIGTKVRAINDAGLVLRTEKFIRGNHAEQAWALAAALRTELPDCRIVVSAIHE